MKLFEYQAKEVFKKAGINVPGGVLIESAAEIDAALTAIGLPCVLKSQVLAGGRGKKGLVKLVSSREEAYGTAVRLFESPYNVRKILVEQAVDMEQELYLSVTVDPSDARAMVIACGEGGVEIETLSQSAPEKIITEKIDLDRGMMGFQAKNIAYAMGVPGSIANKIAAVVQSLYGLFRQYDAELVEINPLFITKQGEVVAGDGKLILDDNSMFRQTEYAKTREYFDTDLEYEASLEGIPYLQFDGEISLMCAGAGLATTVYDLVNYAGGRVANYLEFGGPNYRKAVKAMDICLRNKSKVILIVTFGTIARADVMAEGIAEAIEKLKPDRPIVTCIRGTNEDKAFEILKSIGLEPLSDTEEAVRKAVNLSKGQVKQA